MKIIDTSCYIHFPWCLRKCPYCDFNSHQLRDKGFIAVYVQQLLHDLKIEAQKSGSRELKSIYFGGGTPSLLLPQHIEVILASCGKYFSLTRDIEITLEANPGTVDVISLKAFNAAGINRISLGIQSFCDDKLRALGRVHNAKGARDAVLAMKEAGFANFNFDLMFGLPGQSVSAALLDLESALEFLPPHISWYQLTLETGTAFFARPPKLPQDEEVWMMQKEGQQMLQSAGLFQYEVSAYSKIGHECRHNINYWQYGDYFGIGAGAHGKITLDDHRIMRCVKVSDPQKYLIAKDFVESVREVGIDESPFEFMLNALRLYRPITYELFEERTGVAIDAIESQLARAEDLGLIERKDRAIVTTEMGRNFLNNLLEIFL